MVELSHCTCQRREPLYIARSISLKYILSVHLATAVTTVTVAIWWRAEVVTNQRDVAKSALSSDVFRIDALNAWLLVRGGKSQVATDTGYVHPPPGVLVVTRELFDLPAERAWWIIMLPVVVGAIVQIAGVLRRGPRSSCGVN